MTVVARKIMGRAACRRIRRTSSRTILTFRADGLVVWALGSVEEGRVLRISMMGRRSLAQEDRAIRVRGLSLMEGRSYSRTGRQDMGRATDSSAFLSITRIRWLHSSSTTVIIGSSKQSSLRMTEESLGGRGGDRGLGA